MRKFGVFWILCIVVLAVCSEQDEEEEDDATKLARGEQRLGDQIRAIIKHYQQEDPIGLPGAPIPDPLSVPDMEHTISFTTLEFREINVYGLKNFRIEHIRSDLALMQVSVAVSIETLIIRGLYTQKGWLSSTEGNFTVNLTGVIVQGVARLEVANDGKLRAQDIDMDLTFTTIGMDFTNLGLMGSMLQGVINSVGSFLFDGIKPFILKEVNINLRGEVNKQISQLPQYFPNSISPFDMAVAEARKQVSDMGYDPFRVKDYSQSMGIFTITSSNTLISGLASFYRMGNITLVMEDGKVYAGMDVGTQEVEGTTHWDVSVIGGAFSRAGTVSFTIEYFRVQMKLSQPLDTRKRATLEELNLELGNIQARVHGAGTLDYVLEASVNILPNILRYQIMDAVEGPLKKRLQDELDQVDVEKLIHDKIPEIEEHARQLQGIQPADDIPDEEPEVPQEAMDDHSPFSESEEERGPS